MDANEELASLSDGIVQDNVVSSYVCSMSSEIDLNLRDDLATNVQDYLGRIVDELHLISRWTAECYRYMLVCQEKEKRSEARLKRIAAAGDVESRKTTTAGFSAQQLSIQTELELLRQEMHRVHQGV